MVCDSCWLKDLWKEKICTQTIAKFFGLWMRFKVQKV